MTFLICWLIKTQIRLVKLSDRTLQHCPINSEYCNIQLSSIKDIAEYSKKKTAEMFTFAQHNDVVNGKANCVGYAQYAASLCNKLLIYNNIKANAKPVVGCYYLRSINLNKYATIIANDVQIKNFIKDHDYVEIVDNSGKVVYSFDPSIYDLTYLTFHE